MSDYKNLAELIDVSAQKYPLRQLFGTKINGVWHWITYAEFASRTERLRAAFAEWGMKSGDVAAIISNNCVPFALTVYAAYGLGAAVVPMYEVQKPQDWQYIIQDSGARFIFVGSEHIAETVRSFGFDFIEKIVVFRPESAQAITIDSLIDAHPEGMKRLDIDENSIADILYTSGTTGTPKGVELTHRNIVQNSIYTFEGFEADCRDRSLSFLPWAHAFGKTVELHIFPSFGASVAIAESARTIQTDIRETQPTILNGVPKIFNKFYDAIHQIAQSNPLARKLFEVSDGLAIKSHANRLSTLDKISQTVLQRLLGPKIKAAFGGRIRFCISGGAPLAPEILEFFQGFGITIVEGYGMTETSPIISVNKFAPGLKVKFGSVGLVLSCNTVRIEPVEESPDGKSGEVIVGGDCVMRAYHHAPALTKEVLTENHELHTGDLGYLDEDGYLFLTGRVKEQYKLENGKYVVPGALEEKLKTSINIEHAVIFGAGRPFNVALIRPTDAFIDKFKGEHHLSDAELADNKALHDALASDLQSLTKEFRGYEKPSKFAVVLDEFTIQNGLLTPALKLRRHAVEKKYKDTIERLYHSDSMI